MTRWIFWAGLTALSIALWRCELPLPGTDHLLLKEAAYRLSQGLSFATPSARGLFPGIERVSLFFPPVYQWLFGLWYRLVGFSLAGSLALSWFLCAALAALMVRLFARAVGPAVPAVLYGLAGVAWTVAVSLADLPEPVCLVWILLWLVVLTRWGDPPGSHAALVHGSLAGLLGLAWATSPVVAGLLMPYLFAAWCAVAGVTRRSILRCLTLILWGVAVGAALWAIVIRLDPVLWQQQFVARVFDYAGNAVRIETVVSGLRFASRFGGLPAYGPLLAVLLMGAAPWRRGARGLEWDAARWQFLALGGTWIVVWLKLPFGYHYLYMIHLLVLLVGGVAFVRQVSGIPAPVRRRAWQTAAWAGIVVAALPFVRMAVLPLTWTEEDTYDYTRARLARQIPADAVVLTDPQQWYSFSARTVYDAVFGQHNLAEADYVVLAGGGAGRPDAPRPWFDAAAQQYFEQQFVLQDTTLGAVPNQLLGLPIARSRWGYRYALYRRR